VATSVVTSEPQWLEGCTYDGNGGNDLRLSGPAAYFYDEGIVTGSVTGVLSGVIGGAGLQVSAGGAMTVAVQPGGYVVQNTGTPAAGGYVSKLAQQATLTVQTADPANPRIDIVVAYVSDVGTSSSSGAVEIITGTAAASPSAPSAPANSITLAQLTIPAATTTVTSGMITDERPFTTAAGGILVASKGSVTGYVGQLGYDKASESFYHNTNTGGSKQARVLPWAPVHEIYTPVFELHTGVLTLLSASVTTDGVTDLKISWRIPLITATGSTVVSVATSLDGTIIDEALQTVAASGWACMEGIVYTSPAAGTTPSAAAHTITLGVAGSTATINPNPNSYGAPYLRVEPAGL